MKIFRGELCPKMNIFTSLEKRLEKYFYRRFFEMKNYNETLKKIENAMLYTYETKCLEDFNKMLSKTVKE